MGYVEPETKKLVEAAQKQFHAEIKESVSAVTQKLEAELNEDMLLLRKEVKALKDELAKCKCGG